MQLGKEVRDSGVQGTAHAAFAERELLEGKSEAVLARLMAFLKQTDRQTDLTQQILPLLAWAQAEQGEVSRLRSC